MSLVRVLWSAASASPTPDAPVLGDRPLAGWMVLTGFAMAVLFALAIGAWLKHERR